MKLLNLASNNSFWRGIDYHHENRIISRKELEKNCYQGKVKGSGGALFRNFSGERATDDGLYRRAESNVRAGI